MRNSGLLTVLAISTVIFGGIVFLIWKQPAGFHQVFGGVSVRVTEGPASPQPAAGKKEPKSAKTKSKRPVDPKAPEAAPGLSLKELNFSPEVFRLSTPKPDAPFPGPGDIVAGTMKTNLQKAYGEPSLRTYAVDAGRVLETYVYLKGDRKAATFVRLKDGSVISAHTTFQ